MRKSGHSFPASFGFTGSSGKIPVKGYMRSAPRPKDDIPSVLPAPPSAPASPRSGGMAIMSNHMSKGGRPRGKDNC